MPSSFLALSVFLSVFRPHSMALLVTLFVWFSVTLRVVAQFVSCLINRVQCRCTAWFIGFATLFRSLLHVGFSACCFDRRGRVVCRNCAIVCSALFCVLSYLFIVVIPLIQLLFGYVLFGYLVSVGRGRCCCCDYLVFSFLLSVGNVVAQCRLLL